MSTLRGDPAGRSADERIAFGVVNIDKPPGPTSHQVVSWVKALLGADRAAHAGTLDPKVSGCLPVLLGDATRVAQALLPGHKRYITILELHGEPSTSLDAVVNTFEGELYQKPPRKSAVKRRLRTREIYSLALLEQHERQALLDIRCESGTYIRKLCHHLGLAAGVGAHMGELRRIEAQPFDDTDLVTLHELSDAVALAEDGDSNRLTSIVRPAEDALAMLPRVLIAPSAAESVAQGSPIFAPGVLHWDDDIAIDQQVVGYTPNGGAVCLGRLVGDPGADTGEVISLDRVLV